MASFSATDAAFEGLRLTREQPRMILFWSVLLFAVNILTAVLLILILGSEWEDMQAALGNRSPSQAEALALAGQMLRFYAVAVPSGLLTSAVLQAAACRAIYGREGAGRGFLAFGADELRVLAAEVAVLAMVGSAVFAALIVATLLADAAGGGLIGFLLTAAVLALLVWLSVRFSLAAPQTFVEGRVRVFGSWRLTRGHGWKLLATYALAFVMAAVVGLLVFSIYAAIAAVAGGGVGAAGAMLQADYSAFDAFFTAGGIAAQAAGALVWALVHVIRLSVPVMAYRSLSADPAA